MNAKKIKIACSIIVLATIIIIFSFAVPMKRTFDSKVDSDKYMPMSIGEKNL